MVKVPIGYFGMRNWYCQRRWPLIVPFRSFFEVKPDFAQATVRRASQQGLIKVQNGHLVLTDNGRRTARQF